MHTWIPSTLHYQVAFREAWAIMSIMQKTLGCVFFSYNKFVANGFFFAVQIGPTSEAPIAKSP